MLDAVVPIIEHPLTEPVALCLTGLFIFISGYLIGKLRYRVTVDSEVAELTVPRIRQQYTPWEFEQLIADHFDFGRYEAEVTSGSGDKGMDVLISKRGNPVAGIQAKLYAESNKVGSPEVRDTIGAGVQGGLDSVFIVTAGRYTSQAHQAAEEATTRSLSVHLLDGADLVNHLRGTAKLSDHL